MTYNSNSVISSGCLNALIISQDIIILYWLYCTYLPFVREKQTTLIKLLIRYSISMYHVKPRLNNEIFTRILNFNSNMKDEILKYETIKNSYWSILKQKVIIVLGVFPTVENSHQK